MRPDASVSYLTSKSCRNLLVWDPTRSFGKRFSSAASDYVAVQQRCCANVVGR